MRRPRLRKLWAELARQHDGKDRWYLEALGIGAADKQESVFLAEWLAEVKGQLEHPGGTRHHLAFARDERAGIPGADHHRSGDPRRRKRRYFRALDFISGPEKEAALIEVLGAGTK